MKRLFFGFLLVLISLPLNASQIIKEQVAVLDFVCSGVEKEKNWETMVPDVLMTELMGLNDYNLVERERLEMVMKEQALQNSGVVDNAEAVKIGKLIGARMIIAGCIFVHEKTVILTARGIDVESGKVKFSVKSADSIDLMPSIKVLSEKINDKMIGLYAKKK